MGAGQSTKEKPGRQRAGNLSVSAGIVNQTVLITQKVAQACTVWLAILASQSVWLHAGSANPASTTPSHEDLTARECLAAARLERNTQNWARAITYYQKLDAEFSRNDTQDKQQSAYRLELLDCLLKSANYAEAVSVTERLQSNQTLPAHLKCELIFIKGECLYRLKKYHLARESLSPILSRLPHNHPAGRQRHDRAFLIIADSLLEENLNHKAVEHLSSNAPLDPDIQSMCAAIKATAYLRLHLPEKSSETLAAYATTMSAHHRGAICDSLLVQTAIEFCHANQPEMAIRCILRTRNPEQTVQSLHKQIATNSSQILKAKKHGDQKTLSELTKLEANLNAEIKFASAQKTQLAEAVLLTAMSLASHLSARDAFVLLKYFTELPLSYPEGVIEPHQKMLLGCMLKMERWEEAKNMATWLETKFADPKQKIETEFLKGIAISKTNSPANAITVFEAVSQKSNDPELIICSQTLCACTKFETGDYAGAIATAKIITASYPRHRLSETAQYVIVAANIAAKDYCNAVRAADQYLADKTKTENREQVEFCRAKALFSLNDLPVAISALRDYITHNPNGEKVNEAKLLLGDALSSVGQTTEGIALFNAIPSQATNVHDEAQLRLARALVLNGQASDAVESLSRFITGNPQSYRIADACRELLKAGDLNQARGPAVQSIRSLLEHRPSECRTRCAAEIIELLCNDVHTGVDTTNASTRMPTAYESCRNTAPCGCSIAKTWASWRKSRNSENADNTLEYHYLEEAVANHPSTVPEKILFEMASHYSKTQKTNKSLSAWRELLRWHPCTKRKDQALFNAGLAELQLGRTKQALQQFERLELECRESLLVPKMLMARADTYRRLNDVQRRLDDLTRIAGAKCAPIAIRSRALLEIGEHKIETHQETEALVWLQRVTVTGQSQPEIVARAYERIAFAFERLGNHEAAEKAYAELLANPEFENTSAACEYRSRTSTARPSEM